MRPRLEIRDAVATAAGELVAQGRAGVTWAEVAHHAQVAADAARRTMDNMARAGELVRVGSAAQPGARRPMTLYAPADAGDDEGPTVFMLDDVLRGWLPAMAGT